jgi:hypothetical protein
MFIVALSKGAAKLRRSGMGSGANWLLWRDRLA